MTLTLDRPEPATLEFRANPGHYSGPRTAADMYAVAEQLSTARATVDPTLHGSPGDLLVLLYKAMDLDIGVSVALQSLFWDTSTGQGGMKGSLMLALIMRAGHTVEVLEHTDQVVRMRLTRADHQPGGEAEWTMVQAVAIGLTNSRTWIDYGTDMLFWRCVARLARQFAPDVVLGFGYLPEELRQLPDLPPAGPAAPAALAPEWASLIADANAATTFAAARDLFAKARRREGIPHSVEIALAQRAEALRAAEQDGTPLPDPVEVDAEPAGDAPAGEGAMDCGCDPEWVVANGEHQPGCTELGPWAGLSALLGRPAVAVAPPAAQEEPEEPEPAEEGADDGDVFPAAPAPVEGGDGCDCDPFDVFISGHTCGRA